MPAYTLPPIDYWPGSVTFDPDVVAAEAARDEREAPPSGGFDIKSEERDLRASIVGAHREARERFLRLGWEGDGEWRYGAMPAEMNLRTWVSVKQSNNGTTYVWSEFALPWLDEIAFDRAE